MNRPLVSSLTRLGRRLACRTVGGAVWAVCATASMAAPSQMPLLGQNNTPLPNVLLTIDDSGSMDWPFMPDAVGNLNYTCADFLCAGTISPYSYGGMALDPTEATKVGNGNVASTAAGDLFAAHLRSPQINTLYYNPAVTYQPWPASLRNISSDLVDADGNVKDPAKTPLDPTGNDPTTIDLTKPQTGVSARWCYNLVPLDGSRCAVSVQNYDPAVYFQFSGGSADVNDISKYTRVVVPAGQLRNFANWFTYYRKRILMAKGATAQAFEPYAGKQRFRLGWARINFGVQPDGSLLPQAVPGEDGYTSYTIESGVRLYDDTRQKAFSNWLLNIRPNGGTLLRQAMVSAGSYFSTTAVSGLPQPADDPYRTDPTQATSPVMACRQNFHILVTDGYWNSDDGFMASSVVGNEDGTDGPAQVGSVVLNGASVDASFAYKAAAPYADTYDKTLADAAMYFWKHDLRPDLDNDVPPGLCSDHGATDPVTYLKSCQDPAFWQHMSTYTVGLGVDGVNHYTSDPSTVTWPKPVANSPSTIDDLWHAAVNGHGQYLKVTDPDSFQKSLGAILQNISALSGSSAGVATAGAFLSGGNVEYVPTYVPGLWSGDLSAFGLDASGNVIDASKPLWKASENIPGTVDPATGTTVPGTRTVVAWKDSASRAVNFDYDTLKANGMLASTTTSTGATVPGMDLSGTETDQRNLIAFLRGQAVSGLRSRDPASVLGDIVNSTPRFVKDANFGNAFLPSTTGSAATPTGSDSYAAYLKDKAARSQGVIAFGANDGMFHLVESNDGKEVFAFIPRAVLPKLKNLAAVPYVHQFTVDGPSTEGDVYDPASSQWNNILVATTGAGARSVFALHLPTTAPTSLNPASDMLWEFDGTDNGDLGYVLSAPQVGMLPNGRWVTVFGNGFDSDNGHAVLFVCDALAGCDKSSAITVSTDSGNGLGGVVLVRDARNVIRGAYAGDLKGNVWKFVTGADGNLQVDFGGAPLFTAISDVDGKAQPITAAPAYALNDHGGTVVIVSTGRLYSDDDATSTDHQTIYGLFDPAPVGVGTSAPPVITSTDLVHEQSDASTLADKGYFTITATSVPTAPKGWMLDMSLAAAERLTAAERGIYAPRFIYGVAEVETVVPGGNGVETCAAQTAKHYVYLLNPLTGGQLRVRVVDAYDFVVGGFVAPGSGESGILMQPTGGGPEAMIKLLGPDGNRGLSFGKPPNQYIWQPVVNPPPGVH